MEELLESGDNRGCSREPGITNKNSTTKVSKEIFNKIDTLQSVIHFQMKK